MSKGQATLEFLMTYGWAVIIVVVVVVALIAMNVLDATPNKNFYLYSCEGRLYVENKVTHDYYLIKNDQLIQAESIEKIDCLEGSDFIDSFHYLNETQDFLNKDKLVIRINESYLFV